MNLFAKMNGIIALTLAAAPLNRRMANGRNGKLSHGHAADGVVADKERGLVHAAAG